MKKILTAALLSLMAVSFSATIVWSGDKVVNSDFTVSSTDQLIIEAGTIVRFDDGVRITVYGQIQSMGTEFEPVHMIPSVESYWGGIDINSVSGNNQFNYTIFKDIDVPWETGRDGLTFNQSLVTVFNCRFLGNQSQTGGAIKIISGNTTVSDSYFYMNGAPDGGAIFIENNSPVSSQVNITGCSFEHNDAWTRGGAIFIQDTQSSVIMDLNIIKCAMFENNSGDGGAIYYDNRGHIDMEFSKSRIFNNSSSWGSAIYMKFMETMPGNILAQKFSNLLIFKNNGYDQSGVYIDMGLTQNPQNLNFTNATIAFNSIKPSKEVKQDYTSGIYLKGPIGNFPQIRNSILWQNTDYIGESNFFLEGSPIPQIDSIFRYCDIGGFFAEQPNISAPPLFVRPPLNSEEEYMMDIDRYDFHLSVHSPCANAGDPAEPCTELNSIRVDMGAYGNTMESVRTFQTVLALDVNTSVNVPAGEALVIDFQGKAIKAEWVDLMLSSNSEVYFKASYNADISFQKLITLPGKFDGGIVRIQTLVDTLQGTTTLPQEIVFEENIDLNNANLNDIKLKFQKNPIYPNTSVTLNNSKFFTKDGTMPYGLEIVEADNINIENSKFLGFANGAIKVGYESIPNKTKASGRITNNTVSFDGSASQKTKVGKQVGIEVSNANIDIEDNDIDGGDEGIVMKTNSSGRITNNTVSFDGSASQKSGMTRKSIVLSDNSVSSEISGNTVISYPYPYSFDVIGIEIDNSKADIIGNKVYYGWDSSPYERIGIRLLAPSDTVRIINNTIHGPFTAFSNPPGAFPVPVEIINNIYWSDNSPAVTINDTDTSSVDFMNNCFIDSTHVTGTDNIFSDPEFSGDYSDADFSLSSASPCINAGMIVEGFHTGAYDSKVIYYYGTAPDIGSEEYYQELSAPSNVTTQITGSDISFGWDAVPGYPYYKVYASDNAYSGFNVVAHSSDLSYVASMTPAKKFFYIVATTEPPTKVYVNEVSAEKKADPAPSVKKRNLRINDRSGTR
ncbi:MAG TPA: hypothetical protein PKW56_04430 [Clostridiales bacterium]|nr:hypothetical protein [Clostridiales bacterium]